MIQENNIEQEINKELSIKYRVVPYKFDQDKIIFWTDEYSSNTKEALKILTKKNVELKECSSQDLYELRQKYYSKTDISNIKSIIDDFSDGKILNKRQDFENNDSKIIRLVNYLLDYAIANKASDIHFDAVDGASIVRIRIEGILRDLLKLDRSLSNILINRIKVLAKLDYTVRNIPQDGSFSYKKDGKNIDIRVAVVPTIYSEKLVLRILNRDNVELTRQGIGLQGRNAELVSKLIRQPSGLILSVGPTGSGKSTTLITLLKELKSPEINIMTVEDPVEYKVEGFNQIEINEERGLDFNLGLKSILRLDPDKLMVGEIRDQETARTALRASITGRLVLSSLHTNDSPSAVYRLKDIGVEEYLISAGLIGVISQRLVRKLCDCKVKERKYVELYDETMDIYKPGSCSKCDMGYTGRMAVYEILLLNDRLKEAINSGMGLIEFKRLCKEEGLITLKESMKELLKEGSTSLDEVYKNIMTIGEK